MRNINTNTTSTSTDLYQVTTLCGGTVVFTGIHEQCIIYVTAQGERLDDGTMLFRYWTQDNCEYYDMGNVYCITKK